MESITLSVRPDVRAHLVINCVVGFLVLFIVSARLFARKYMGAGIGLDDILIVCAVPLCFALLGIQGEFSRLGSGYPVTEVMANLPLILPLTFAFQLIYLAALGLIKSSILCFYIRVFVSRRMRLATHIMFGVVVAWALAHALAVIFVCTPVSYQWDLTLDGKCGDQITLFKSLIMTNILTDVAIILLPIYTVWQLKMRKTEKVAVTACFLIGTAVIIAAIFRYVYVSTVDIRGDLTGTMPITVFLSAFEPNLSVLCVSIPMLRPCYVKYREARAAAKRPWDGSTDIADVESAAKSSKLKDSGNSRANGRYDLELDTICSPEYDIKYKATIDVGARTEETHSIAESGSESGLTQAHGESDSRITVEKKWAILHH
ncbi:hypothetical protein F4778DRAFT_711631 [Xylariomycetidae sp. FL2044]|nr:hypothetical protein F4778DRAFT_711631 [Xylariomycetidae sp. FL2044]